MCPDGSTDHLSKTAGQEPLPLLPLGANPAGLRASYRRAGLPDWTSPSSQSQPQPGAKSGVEADLRLLRPMATLDCCIHDVLVTLPHDRDPGTAHRYTELWAKAFETVLLTPASLLSQSENTASS